MNEPPVSYDAEEAGPLIGKSAYWMKSHARAGEIPFTRVGREMRWTPDHLAEILRAGEQRPRPAALTARQPRRSRAVAAAPVLQSRPQRRKTA